MLSGAQCHVGFAVFRTARIDNLRYRNTRGNTTPRDDSDELARKGGVTEGHAWVNYDEGPSKGEGSGGKFYQAEGERKWSHDVVYDQNEALANEVGTQVNPTVKILDCTQGTVGKGKHGEATNLRQTQYKANQGNEFAIEQLKLIKKLRECKAAVSLSVVVVVVVMVVVDAGGRGLWGEEGAAVAAPLVFYSAACALAQSVSMHATQSAPNHFSPGRR